MNRRSFLRSTSALATVAAIAPASLVVPNTPIIAMDHAGDDVTQWWTVNENGDIRYLGPQDDSGISVVDLYRYVQDEIAKHTLLPDHLLLGEDSAA